MDINPLIQEDPKARTFRKLAGTALVGFGLTICMLSAASAQTLKIGVIGALTGPGAPWGLAAQHGARILAADVNAKGGLEVSGKTYKVEVVAYDDQYKATDAVAAYQRLVKQDDVKFLILMSSPSTMALKQSIEDDKIVALTSGITPFAVDAKSKYMFRLFSNPVDYVPSFVAWLKDNVPQRRVVILNPNDEAGLDQNQLCEGLYKKAGFNVLGKELFERGQKDFQPLLTKIVGMKPDVIDLASTAPATAGILVRQTRELGYKGLFVKSSGPSPREVVAAAGKEASEGMVNLLYVDPANPGYKSIATEYKRAVGQDPNEIIVPFYDATNVLLRAIQKSGSVSDTTKVAASFSQALPMKSVQGDTLTLGGKAHSGVDHQIMTVDYIGVIKNGEPVAVGKVR
ncbi:ABC transporter substrate-binding protein [Variovorax saccharolyticus]|uniref:ABC transporter substrate-binding protein n=1 Tax=Variovorax saccharolyticus TaxID=3053516 RepID=UPI00257740EF|nr:ABC transporter substrate-binding protein [Variovorax sp. J22R187]MDM0021807.1 ABC transporter substrate-binding protein [Variovorax sp. J22R187]